MKKWLIRIGIIVLIWLLGATLHQIVPNFWGAIETLIVIFLFLGVTIYRSLKKPNNVRKE